ncbi:hypothetical protein FOMPIDRAFT_1054838 [Fomitopsis schrenkii]|uniref:Uncharacterized protein n=1 Tax=Fomitopsis schrenkii TaxID=2126942 RepID=S8DPV8_FOMSC|nr:hypothetical protein FOMPIDRAFT_1054838 [Fomitopsis schrenkii]
MASVSLEPGFDFCLLVLCRASLLTLFLFLGISPDLHEGEGGHGPHLDAMRDTHRHWSMSTPAPPRVFY